MRYTRFPLLAVLAVVAGCTDSTGPDRGSRTEEFKWTGTVDPTATVEIKNTNGDVRARPSSDGVVRVRASIEGRDDAPSTVRIDVVETDRGVTICAVYPDVPGRPVNECLPGLAGELSSRDSDVSVTFDVEVPVGRAFACLTVGGSVEAMDLSGYVDVRTLAGDVDIATSGVAQATTVTGNITATIGSPSWDRGLTFATLDGDVQLRIPPQTSADVWGSTGNGSISTDFPLSVTRVGATRWLQGRLGSGGSNLWITAGTGDIALRRR